MYITYDLLVQLHWSLTVLSLQTLLMILALKMLKTELCLNAAMAIKTLLYAVSVSSFHNSKQGSVLGLFNIPIYSFCFLNEHCLCVDCRPCQLPLLLVFTVLKSQFRLRFFKLNLNSRIRITVKLNAVCIT